MPATGRGATDPADAIGAPSRTAIVEPVLESAGLRSAPGPGCPVMTRRGEPVTAQSSSGAAEFDVIVVGSGVAALFGAAAAASRGLTTCLVEKTDRFGGTSAYSGGAVW